MHPETDSSTSNNETKRPRRLSDGNRTVHRKRRFQRESDRSPIKEGQIHGRWLIESHRCARVLGQNGNRLRYMKDLTNDSEISLWISPRVENSRFRIFNCIGSTSSVSRIAGLFVRSINDETEGEKSGRNSRSYDLRFLVPHRFTSELAGPNHTNLSDAEKRSNTKIKMSKSALPNCDEQCINIYGVADAVEIATYILLKSLIKVYKDANFNHKNAKLILYTPGEDQSPKIELGSPSPTRPLHDHDSKSFEPKSTPKQSFSETHEPERKDKKFSPSPVGLYPAISLPPLAEDINLPSSIYAAYETAKESTRDKIRQMVQISCKNATQKDRNILLENIDRVTNCNVEIVSDDTLPHLDDDDISIIIEGTPEDNSLALFLVYRFLRENSI